MSCWKLFSSESHIVRCEMLNQNRSGDQIGSTDSIHHPQALSFPAPELEPKNFAIRDSCPAFSAAGLHLALRQNTLPL